MGGSDGVRSAASEPLVRQFDFIRTGVEPCLAHRPRSDAERRSASRLAGRGPPIPITSYGVRPVADGSIVAISRECLSTKVPCRIRDQNNRVSPSQPPYDRAAFLIIKRYWRKFV